MIKVSVILTVYNKEEFVLRSINSVLSQSYPYFELLVINDGSTDNSKEIILGKSRQDSRIVYIEQENKGVSSARNLGISNAQGEYISFLDADDILDSSFLEKMEASINNQNVCYCGYLTSNRNNLKKSKAINFKEGDILLDYILNKNTPNTNCWLIRKSFLIANNLSFDEKIDWGEDMTFFSKVLFHEKKVTTAKEYLSTYFLNIENSLSVNSLDKIDKDILWMNLLKEYIKSIESDNLSIKGIDSYRLPASIIYRLHLNKYSMTGKEIKEVLKKNQHYLEDMSISNNLRSLKLWFYYIFILLYSSRK